MILNKENFILRVMVNTFFRLCPTNTPVVAIVFNTSKTLKAYMEGGHIEENNEDLKDFQRRTLELSGKEEPFSYVKEGNCKDGMDYCEKVLEEMMDEGKFKWKD